MQRPFAPPRTAAPLPLPQLDLAWVSKAPVLTFPTGSLSNCNTAILFPQPPSPPSAPLRVEKGNGAQRVVAGNRPPKTAARKTQRRFIPETFFGPSPRKRTTAFESSRNSSNLLPPTLPPLPPSKTNTSTIPTDLEPALLLVRWKDPRGRWLPPPSPPSPPEASPTRRRRPP